MKVLIELAFNYVPFHRTPTLLRCKFHLHIYTQTNRMTSERLLKVNKQGIP